MPICMRFHERPKVGTTLGSGPERRVKILGFRGLGS